MKFVITPFMHILCHADILFGFDIITACQPVVTNAANVPNLLCSFNSYRVEIKVLCFFFFACHVSFSVLNRSLSF